MEVVLKAPSSPTFDFGEGKLFQLHVAGFWLQMWGLRYRARLMKLFSGKSIGDIDGSGGLSTAFRRNKSVSSFPKKLSTVGSRKRIADSCLELSLEGNTWTGLG
ncbi:Uncharacterized protein Rs2_07623 [Raphanus sativus]|nr:Uncharacterized protein Rs2_07623 [Raphanus sativus]